MELNRSLPILFSIFILALSSCGLYRSSKVNTKAFDELENPILVQSANSAFPMPDIPESIKDGQEHAIYLSKHYWDKFPFNDTSLISKPEITEQGFVDYIHILNYIPFNNARRSVRIMLYKARENPTMLAHLGSLFQKYYYDANSPFRNEELYIPVLESLLSSQLLSETDYEKYDFQKEMIHKNRIGTKAADFVYTLPNGTWKRMHAYKSDYLILLFIKPECKVCEEIKNEIENSKMLNEVFSRNSFNRSMLTVLTIYPDADVEQWRKLLPQIPQKNWVHGYDKDMTITHKRVYDIKTIPTMYFLNRNKKILLKDTSVEEIESYFMKSD
ncbi:MAG: DUF5106 domain-containing protein [Dysgonamonadaceae bacterium]|jgi:hypothetical protein|nr:DUF5106 domain-containing protein [Dysgonamonadaceae bacterium]HUI33747.1 DUF5106 domain-containing protein [Dysgonamonadaceae bacterium]